MVFEDRFEAGPGEPSAKPEFLGIGKIGAFADPLHRIPTRQQTTPHEASSLAAGY